MHTHTHVHSHTHTHKHEHIQYTNIHTVSFYFDDPSCCDVDGLNDFLKCLKRKHPIVELFGSKFGVCLNYAGCNNCTIYVYYNYIYVK